MYRLKLMVPIPARNGRANARRHKASGAANTDEASSATNEIMHNSWNIATDAAL
jgi:hypothetical protein